MTAAAADPLSTLAARVASRTTNAVETLATNAQRIAGGEGYDVAAVEAALFDSRTDLATFRQMIETAKERASQLAIFEQLAASRTVYTRLTQTMEAERARFDKVHAAFVEKQSGLELERQAASSRVADAERAREWLTHPDHILGSLGPAIRDARDRLAKAISSREQSDAYVRDAHDKARHAQGWLDQESRVKSFDPAILADDKERRRLERELDAETLATLDEHAKHLKRAQANAAAAAEVLKADAAAVEQIRAELSGLEAQALS
jgi:hypothetical protein